MLDGKFMSLFTAHKTLWILFKAVTDFINSKKVISCFQREETRI